MNVAHTPTGGTPLNHSRDSPFGARAGLLLGAGMVLPVRLKAVFSLFRQALDAWSDDYAPSMGAALAYYTLFSVAPLLLIVISVAGLVFGAGSGARRDRRASCRA